MESNESNELPEEQSDKKEQEDAFPELQFLHPNDHIEVDKYSSAVYIKNSKAMRIMRSLTDHMSDVHKNTINDIHEKYDYRQRIARSYHQQAVSIVRKYLPLYKEKYAERQPVFMRDVEVALEEAARLQLAAIDRAEDERTLKAQGNVVFSRQTLKEESSTEEKGQ